MINGIRIDGTLYSNVHITSLKRDGEILDGDNAGRVSSGSMDRDIKGTFYNYTVAVDADALSYKEYDELYEVLTSPKEFHTIEMPYGQGTIVYKAYVASVSDEVKTIGETTSWGNMSFKFVGKDPYRRP